MAEGTVKSRLFHGIRLDTRSQQIAMRPQGPPKSVTPTKAMLKQYGLKLSLA